MKLATLMALLTPIGLSAATTTISDTVMSPFGTGLFSGTISVTCSRAQTSGGNPIATGTTVITVSAGAFSVQIQPYDSTTPSTPCTVVYNATDSLGNPLLSFERWVVPTSTQTLRIQDVLVTAATNDYCVGWILNSNSHNATMTTGTNWNSPSFSSATANSLPSFFEDRNILAGGSVAATAQATANCAGSSCQMHSYITCLKP